MKIRILKNVLVEINKIRLDEVWDKSLQRRDELNVESINVDGKYANLTTYDGDVILNIPVDAYEVLT